MTAHDRIDNALDSADDRGSAELMAHEPLLGQEKWLGGALGADGNVYGVPGHAWRVLMIEPKSGRVSKIGPEFKGKYKWLRGVPAPDGAVYCLPCHAESVLRIDCTTAPPTPSLWRTRAHTHILRSISCLREEYREPSQQSVQFRKPT